MRKLYTLLTICLIASLWSWAQDEITIDAVEVFPNIATNSIRVNVTLNNENQQTARTRVALSLGSGKPDIHFCDLQPGQQEAEFIYKMPADTKLWTEFQPEYYSLNVVVSTPKMPKRIRTTTFAMREISHDGHHILLNGKPILLRSTLMSRHFPPNDVPPTTEEAWAKVFHTAKNWGLNCIVFHDWCPPEVAFKVANRMGILLLPQTIGLTSIYGRNIYPDLEELPAQSRAWMLSSGATAVENFKREVEHLMLTDSVSGYQLIGLQDCPVEGKHYVGLLDEMWDSKGIISAAQWRQWCAPVTILADYDKNVYNNGENFYATIKVSNYSQDTLRNKQVKWEIIDINTTSVLASGQMRHRDLPIGELTTVGEVRAQLLSIVQPVEAEMKVWIDGTEIINTWPLWVFPYFTQEGLDKEAQGIMLTRSLDQAIASLSEGKKVLFAPYSDELGAHGVAPESVLGLICNPDHPSLKDFPTRFYGDWQWEPLFRNSLALDVSNIPEIHPLVWLIDNYTTNRRLAPLFEVKCGEGKLIVSTFALWEETLLDYSHPERAQLLLSLLKYMKSANFNPEGSISPDQLRSLINE